MLLSKSALEECTDEPVEHGRSDPPSSAEHSYDAVVIGLTPPLLDYAHLNTAFRILIGENRPQDTPTSQLDPTANSAPDSDASAQAQAQAHPRPPLIALHKARYLEAPDHALSLGPGPFVNALEDAARTSARVVGKPTRAFFETVLGDLERDLDLGSSSSTGHGHGTPAQPPSPSPSEPPPPPRSCPHRWEGIAVIGDDVLADLGEGAVELGLWRVLGASPFIYAFDAMHHALTSG